MMNEAEHMVGQGGTALCCGGEGGAGIQGSPVHDPIRPGSGRLRYLKLSGTSQHHMDFCLCTRLFDS